MYSGDTKSGEGSSQVKRTWTQICVQPGMLPLGSVTTLFTSPSGQRSAVCAITLEQTSWRKGHFLLILRDSESGKGLHGHQRERESCQCVHCCASRG